MIISSLKNSKIQHLVKLRKKNIRLEYEEILIDDLKAIMEAFNHKIEIISAYISEPNQFTSDYSTCLKLLISKEVQIVSLPAKVFKKISYGDIETGIIVHAKTPEGRTLEDLSTSKGSLFIILDNLEKPGNIGAILRSCDAVNCTAVISYDQKTDLFNPNIIRASKGTCFSVPFINADFQEILTFIKNNQIDLYTLTPDGSNHYLKANFTGSAAILAGNEHLGVSKEWRSHSKTLFIPMLGTIDSLNVAQSVTILVYEALRQKISH